MTTDPIIKLMRDASIPVTREKYIHIAYMGQPPEEWTAELESRASFGDRSWRSRIP